MRGTVITYCVRQTSPWSPDLSSAHLDIFIPWNAVESSRLRACFYRLLCYMIPGTTALRATVCTISGTPVAQKVGQCRRNVDILIQYDTLSILCSARGISISYLSPSVYVCLSVCMFLYLDHTAVVLSTSAGIYLIRMITAAVFCVPGAGM